MKATPVRIILVLVAALDLKVNRMDVETAYSNGDLDEVVYMEQPKRFEEGSLVFRLHLPIYGLKQAHRR